MDKEHDALWIWAIDFISEKELLAYFSPYTEASRGELGIMIGEAMEKAEELEQVRWGRG